MKEEELRATIPLTPGVVNALVGAIGGLTMAIADVLTPEQKEKVADNLSRLASAAERTGDKHLQTLLTDLHRAARS